MITLKQYQCSAVDWCLALTDKLHTFFFFDLVEFGKSGSFLRYLLFVHVSCDTKLYIFCLGYNWLCVLTRIVLCSLFETYGWPLGPFVFKDKSFHVIQLHVQPTIFSGFLPHWSNHRGFLCSLSEQYMPAKVASKRYCGILSLLVGNWVCIYGFLFSSVKQETSFIRDLTSKTVKHLTTEAHNSTLCRAMSTK